MRSPMVAMLWEHWRLTRLEAAQRLSLGLVGGSALLALSDRGATLAFFLLLSQHAMFWMSIAKLNGGRMLDGYRPGFPLHFLYTRPVSTVTFVWVAMVYDAVSCAALYLVSAALLGFASGQPLPLLSVAVWIVAIHMVSTFVQWSTRDRVIQWLGSFSIALPFFLLIMARTDWSPLRVEFSPAENAVMVCMALVAFGLTVAGVSRQRRGDPPVVKPWLAGLARYLPAWRADMFWFACPTSSATRAQVWFEMRSSGLLVLAIGGVLAIVIPLLFLITTHIDVALSALSGRQVHTRAAAVVVAMFALPAVLLLGGNAFGIRARQGRRYAGVFEATQAYRTVRIAGIKVLVRSVCLLASLAAVGTSVWISASVIPFDVLTDNDTFIEKSSNPVSGWMRAIEGAVGAMSVFELLALALVAAIVVAVMVAFRAAFTSLRARYPRHLNIAGSLLLLHGLVLVLVGMAEQRGLQLVFSQDLTNRVNAVVVAAGVLATAYLFWAVLAERLFTPRQACGAILVSAAFGAAWVTVLTGTGVPLSAMPAGAAVGMLLPVLLPLAASVLAPWSLSRIRHT